MDRRTLDRYIRTEAWPSQWCPGCGIGIVVGAMLRAIDRLELEQDRVVIGTGIGCTGLIYNYLKFDAFHSTHGRALTVATGIKMARPELTVIVPMGDGDCAAIGGNHLVHAARRNIDVTAIVINNLTYGMTGGQCSPTTPFDSLSTTAPYGHVEDPLDICELARAAGATYVARGATVQAKQLSQILEKAIQHKGFSLVEVLSQCPVQFGRRNSGETAPAMMRRQREMAISAGAAAGMDQTELAGRVVLGEIVNVDAPEREFTRRYEEMVRRVQRKKAA